MAKQRNGDGSGSDSVAVRVRNDDGQRTRGYEQGTLLIDVVDRYTERLVWRGWAQADISGLINDQARLGKRVDEAVHRIFELFPRATTSGVTATAGR